MAVPPFRDMAGKYHPGRALTARHMRAPHPEFHKGSWAVSRSRRQAMKGAAIIGEIFPDPVEGPFGEDGINNL